MKKSAMIILTFALLLTLCACSHTDPVIDSLPEYQNKLFYTSGGIQDFTDYAQYTFKSVTAQNLEPTKYFRAVSADDIEEILLHIDNFEEWVNTIGSDLKAHYDFDNSIVSEGDYFYINSKYGQPIGQSSYGKFDNYTIYFFDLDTQILFCFHHNI